MFSPATLFLLFNLLIVVIALKQKVKIVDEQGRLLEAFKKKQDFKVKSPKNLKVESQKNLKANTATTTSCASCGISVSTTCDTGTNCYSCGYVDSITGLIATGSSDCIACQDGFEIDVVFSDCSGMCVTAGTATNPLSTSSCTMPCSQCGWPYHAYVDDTTCATECSTSSSSTCYTGGTTGACHRCGYNADLTQITNDSDCVSCEEGYEIQVVYTDCTGKCVPVGTSNATIAASTCEMPCATCTNQDLDGFVTAGASSTEVMNYSLSAALLVFSTLFL